MSEQNANSMNWYIVEKGDTLEKIALKYLGSVSKSEELIELNQIKAGEKIHEGQTLELPKAKQFSSTKEPKSEKKQYVVRYGDTLWKIAEKCLDNPSRWPEIVKLNHLRYPQHLFVGQPLILPSDAKLTPSAMRGTGPIRPQSETRKFAQVPATILPMPALYFRHYANPSKRFPSPALIGTPLKEKYSISQHIWDDKGITTQGSAILNKDLEELQKTLPPSSNQAVNTEFYRNLDAILNNLNKPSFQFGAVTSTAVLYQSVIPFERWMGMRGLTEVVIGGMESSNQRSWEPLKHHGANAVIDFSSGVISSKVIRGVYRKLGINKSSIARNITRSEAAAEGSEWAEVAAGTGIIEVLGDVVAGILGVVCSPAFVACLLAIGVACILEMAYKWLINHPQEFLHFKAEEMNQLTTLFGIPLISSIAGKGENSLIFNRILNGSLAI